LRWLDEDSILSLKALFEATWIEPDSRRREYAWSILRGDVAKGWERLVQFLTSIKDSGMQGTARLPAVGQESPVEQAFAYLLKNHNRALHCPNPDGPAPYFFATKQNQRYCSEMCAQAGRKLAKLKWWNETGREQRQNKKKAGTKRRKIQTRREING